MRKIVLVSLFDGIGTAYIGLRRMLRSAGLLDCISAAFYIDISTGLAAAVQNHWDRVAADGLSCPYHFITADVWDLLRDDAALTCHLAKFIPRDCLVLVVGGSPCLQLTPMVDRGKAGLTGPESFNFFIFHFFLYLLQNLRLDALIHGVVENAGKARPEHLNAIVDALGIHPNQAPRIDSLISPPPPANESLHQPSQLSLPPPLIRLADLRPSTTAGASAVRHASPPGATPPRLSCSGART